MQNVSVVSWHEVYVYFVLVVMEFAFVSCIYVLLTTSLYRKAGYFNTLKYFSAF